MGYIVAARDVGELAIVALVALATGPAAEVLVGRKIVALAIGPVAAAVAEILAGRKVDSCP
jgi:hypothetical protein